ncbi:hypothetical protein R77592_04251 [Ralstonia mannitolilytica]|uniref:hypothetical protein n=1 Tax=Ralstonia mannitolilytica TaxID=105219 RepID=UPI0028F60047|nr:hypothetical protein [Ralstonia mannitolilytica]CAJ0737209.1 hypothetical protein R77592_04251 [Ralstonia mannitolilytica]
MSHGDWDKDLVAMRTRYWAKIVKEKAGFEGKKDIDFIDACRYGKTTLSELGGMTWAGYLSGKNNPVYKTVNNVEDVVPNTAINFYKGPKGLELWKILAGDAKEEEAEPLLDSTLEAEYGKGATANWDLGQKVFWLILPMLAFPVAPFMEQMIQEGKIRDGQALPWSDIQHLVDRGVINPPLNGGEVILSSLLAACDDSRKIYTLENTFLTFGPRLIGYAFECHNKLNLGFTLESIVSAFGLLPLTEKTNNNSLKFITKTLIEGLTFGAINHDLPEVGDELTQFVKTKFI